MYPYPGKLRWLIRGRHNHLIDAILAEPHMLKGGRGGDLWQRVQIMQRWLRVRLAALVVISFTAVAGVISIVLRALPSVAELSGLLRTLVQISSSLATLAALLYMFSNRVLRQAEIDALMLMHFQNERL